MPTDTAMTSATKMMLPMGEALVRGIADPFDGVLYAFTAAYEYSGEPVPFGTPAAVSVPLSAERDSYVSCNDRWVLHR